LRQDRSSWVAAAADSAAAAVEQAQLHVMLVEDRTQSFVVW